MSWTAWTKTTENGRVVASSSAVSAIVTDEPISSKLSAVMDFIPAGKDFIVIANTAKVNTSVSGHIELFVGYSKTGTFYRHFPSYLLTDTVGFPFMYTRGAIDTQTRIIKYDVANYGEFPWYKLKFAGGTTDGCAAITVKVAVSE